MYGGLDGSINTLIIILTGIAAASPSAKIMAFCAAAIVGDGIGMGLGDYLSARAEIEYIKAEEAREMYEVEHMLNDEKKEIIDIYREKGFSIDDSARIADLLATNKQAFVNVMMLEELGLVVIDDILALKCGVATLISFIVLGALPAIPYFIVWGIEKNGTPQAIPVIIIGVVELFSLGAAKASMIGLSPVKSGLETLIVGSVITAIGYGLGLLFNAKGG